MVQPMAMFASALRPGSHEQIMKIMQKWERKDAQIFNFQRIQHPQPENFKLEACKTLKVEMRKG